jgi:tetratricopeptide (TPR) repeat protein
MIWNVPFLAGVVLLLSAAGANGATVARIETHQAARAYDEGQRAIFHRDYEKAQAAFERAVALDSSLADGHYYLRMVYGTQQQWHRAAQAFQQATIADPNYIEAFYKLGDTYLKVLARASEAVPPLQRAVQMDPHHAESHRLLGLAYFRQQRLDDSINELQRAIELDPSRGEAFYTLGLAYFQLGAFESASVHFRQIIEKDPFHAKAYLSLGNCYRRMDRLQDGEQALVTFQRLTREEEEMEHLQGLVGSDATNHDAWYQLGRVQLRRAQWSAATFAFEKCIALNPQSVRGYEALGYVYFKLKAYWKAMEVYQEVVKQRPNVATYRNSLGGIYLMNGTYPEAIEQFQTAIRLNPSESRFHLNLSKTYELAGENEKAKEEYRLYQRLSSEK